jgi:hypothetical protein
MKPIESTGHKQSHAEREAAALATVAARLDWCAMHLDVAGYRELAVDAAVLAKRVAELKPPTAGPAGTSEENR